MASGIAPGIRVGHIQYNDAFAYDSDTCEDAVSSATSSEVAHVVDESFLPRILALFFAIFHPTEGPKVVYQVPEGSVTAEEVGDTKAKGQRCKGPSTPGVESTQRDAFLEQEQLFDFENLSEYLIPKAPLCGKLITCTIKGLRSRNSRGTRREGEPLNYCQRSSQKRASSGVQRYYKVLSHPVLLQDSNKYERNTFIFNLAFVFDGKADVKSYEPVVRKCARTLKDLEVSRSFLSSPQTQPRMYGVVEQMFQDLNSYCESFLDLPEAYHSKETHSDGRVSQPILSPTSAFPRNSMFFRASDSLSRNSSLRRQRETTRKLSTAAEGLLSQKSPQKNTSLLDARRHSATASSKQLADESPAFDPVDPAALAPAMSPIDESSTSLDGGLVNQTPISPQTATKDSDITSDAAALDSSRLTTGSIVGSRRPSFPRNKTTSTAAISEAKARVMARMPGSGFFPVTMQRALSSSSAGSSSIASNGNADALAFLTTVSNAPAEDSGREQEWKASFEAIAAELSSSLMSLRQMAGDAVDQEHGIADLADPETISIIPQPKPRPAGQREPPHGLGRTVREAINLKLFPTYANPPPVRDWDVPVSLLDLGRNRAGTGGIYWSSSWDLTMAAVYPFINGINHIKRISQLADADLELTRQCMEHLLYYGCILMIDIFQFSNIYTLKPAVARMADDTKVQAECGPYVTRPGYPIPPWPTLLSLYTALRPGVVLDQWIEDRRVESMGIDVRRFVTFGVIKGFIRRMHRFPVLLGGPEVLTELLQDEVEAAKILRSARVGAERGAQTSIERENLGMAATHLAAAQCSPFSSANARRRREETALRPIWNRRQDSDLGSIQTVRASSNRRREESKSSVSPHKMAGLKPHLSRKFSTWSLPMPAARASRYSIATVADAANIALETVESRPHGLRAEHCASPEAPGSGFLQSSSLYVYSKDTTPGTTAMGNSSPTLQSSEYSRSGGYRGASGFFSDAPTKSDRRLRPGTSFDGSTLDNRKGQDFNTLLIPPDLPYMLNGLHCEDDICVHLGISWPQLRRLLIQIGRFVTSAQRQRPQEQLTKSNNESGREGEDWISEKPAFGNVSGFAGQSGFASQSGLQSGFLRSTTGAGSSVHGGASIWQLPSYSNSNRAGSSRCSVQGNRSSTTGRPDVSSSRRACCEPRESEGQNAGADASSFASFTPQSLMHSLDDLEIDDDEERVEKAGDLEGVLLVTF